MAGGRKLEAERQRAERQDEERATGAERPEVGATRRAWMIRLGRMNLPLLHARRLSTGTRTIPYWYSYYTVLYRTSIRTIPTIR